MTDLILTGKIPLSVSDTIWNWLVIDLNENVYTQGSLLLCTISVTSVFEAESLVLIFVYRLLPGRDLDPLGKGEGVKMGIDLDFSPFFENDSWGTFLNEVWVILFRDTLFIIEYRCPEGLSFLGAK
jgi:hypothetical protein